MKKFTVNACIAILAGCLFLTSCGPELIAPEDTIINKTDGNGGSGDEESRPDPEKTDGNGGSGDE